VLLETKHTLWKPKTKQEVSLVQEVCMVVN
jgi:hypothetical protein